LKPCCGRLLAGAGGGFLANFASRSIWSHLKQPKLEIENKVAHRRYHAQPIKNELDQVTYQFRVHNNGKSVARGCSGYIYLEGEDSEKSYKLRTQVCWSKSEKVIKYQ